MYRQISDDTLGADFGSRHTRNIYIRIYRCGCINGFFGKHCRSGNFFGHTCDFSEFFRYFLWPYAQHLYPWRCRSLWQRLELFQPFFGIALCANRRRLRNKPPSPYSLYEREIDRHRLVGYDHLFCSFCNYFCNCLLGVPEAQKRDQRLFRQSEGSQRNLRRNDGILHRNDCFLKSDGKSQCNYRVRFIHFNFYTCVFGFQIPFHIQANEKYEAIGKKNCRICCRFRFNRCYFFNGTFRLFLICSER